MATQHSTLTGTDLHEPKGAASASNRQLYLSNGSGSGNWRYNPTGWGFWREGGATQTVTSTPAVLSIDGTGSLTTVANYPPEIRGGSTALWDTSTNTLQPLHLNDVYIIRVVLPFTSKTGAPSDLVLALDDSGAGTNTILEYYFDLTRSVPFTATATFTTFAGSNLIANGGQFYVNTDANSIVITGANIMITRIHDGQYY